MPDGDVQKVAPAGGSREQPQTAPQTGAEAQPAAVVGAAEAQQQLKVAVDPIARFTSLVLSGDHDFEGSDRTEEDTEKRPHFLRIKQGFQAFLEKSKGIKPEFYQPWAMAAVDFLVAEVASYKGMTGHPMGYDDVTKALDVLEDPAKIGNSKLPGIGSLENWIKTQPDKTLAEKFAAWKSGEDARGTVEAAKAKIPLGVVNFPGVKTRLEALAKSTNVEDDTKVLVAFAAAILAAHGNASNLEVKLALLPCPDELLAEVMAAKTSIENYAGDQVVTLSEEIHEIEQARLPSIEKLAGLLAGREVLQALRDKLTAEVKAGTKTVEVATKELEGTGDEPDDEPDDGEDAPMVDKLVAWSKKLGGNKILGGLIAAITAFAVGISKFSWGRKMFGNKLMSNKLLAQHGVKEAELAYHAETEIRKFGLPRSLASDLGDASTKEAIAELKKSAASTATEEADKVKLRQFVGQLEAKGGAESKLTLAEFVSNDRNPAWADIEYTNTAAPVAVAATATTPTPPVAGAPKVG
ncbi:MAG: hypothetical protein AAB606_00535 [Patescibacteria group bacterium]